jgi:hypothetical protein
MPLWHILLMLTPLGIISMIIMCVKMAKNFGRSGAFGLGLLLLPFIFYPILGFSSWPYLGNHNLATDQTRV